MWEKELKAGDEYVLMCMEAVHIGMDDEHLDEGQKGRFGETGYLYNIRRTVNPEKMDDRPSEIAILKKL